MSQNSAKGSQTSFIAGGDLSGSNSSQTVIGLRSNPIASQTLNGSTDGYALTWDNTDGYWRASPATFTPGGDLSGNSVSQTVIGLRSNPIASQTLNGSTDGYALTWDNADGYWRASPVSATTATNVISPANNYVASSGDVVILTTASNTVKLKASPVDNDQIEVLNMSGGVITVDANGGTIYIAGSSDILSDDDAVTYRYIGGGVAQWKRI